MLDLWDDIHDETASDAIAMTMETQINDLISIMEEAMPWYDHVACCFLLYSNPKVAREKIEEVLQVKHQPKENWKKVALSALLSEESDSNEELWLRLIESLHVLNYYQIIDNRSLSYPVSAGSLDTFRLELFNMIDSMSKEEAIVFALELQKKFQHKFELKDDWPIELYLLKWLESKDITKENWDFPKRSEIPIPKNGKRLPTGTQPSLPAVKLAVDKLPELRKFTVRSGLCVIVNQMNFYINYLLPPELLKRSKSGLMFRYGSDTDRDSLSEVFRMLGFDVQVYENLTLEAIGRTMESISKTDFSKYDAFVMCLLSHGDRNVIYTTDSIALPLDAIKTYFNGVKCPALLNKPKLFFMQACQGVQDAPVVEFEHDGSLSAYANFFEAWATVPGFLSYRSTIAGAIFVQNLRWALQQHGHKLGLSDLMALVNARVGIEEVTRLGCKQISCYTSSLTGTLEFKRNKDKLVAAVLDNIERQIFHAALVETAKALVKTKPRVVAWLLRTYGC